MDLQAGEESTEMIAEAGGPPWTARSDSDQMACQ